MASSASLGSAAPGYDSDLTLRGLYALGSAAASPGERVDGISVETSQVLSSGSVSVALFGEDDSLTDPSRHFVQRWLDAYLAFVERYR